MVIKNKDVVVHRKDGRDIITAGASKDYLEKSAEVLRPHGLVYRGTALVHIYETPFGDQTEFLVMTHRLAGLPERMLDAALKELRRSLMVLCGRKVE